MTPARPQTGMLDIEAIAARFGEHVAEIIERHVVAAETPVEDARNQLSAMLERALEGQCQVIGKRRRALLISFEEVAAMLKEASMPATWGEAFDPTEELPGIATALRISEDRAPRPEFLAPEPELQWVNAEAAGAQHAVQDQRMNSAR